MTDPHLSLVEPDRHAAGCQRIAERYRNCFFIFARVRNKNVPCLPTQNVAYRLSGLANSNFLRRVVLGDCKNNGVTLKGDTPL